MRVHRETINQDFANWLDIMFYDTTFYGRITLSSKISQVSDLKLFIEFVFSTSLLTNAHCNFDSFNDRAILVMHNETITRLNDLILQSLQGRLHSLEFVDFVKDETQQDCLSSEFLRTLESASLSSSRLSLKVGAPVMLLRNMYPKQGLCNDTRLIVTRVSRTVLEGKILGGSMNDKTRLIPRISLCSTKEELPWILRRKQFSVRLCFVIIVNKAQDQSLNTIGVDLRSSAFTHDQLYVTLSRVTNVIRLTILLTERGDEKTENIVYPEVLLRI